MATSVIEICNRALRAIGQEVITSLADDSTRASLCSLHYEPTRNAVLRAHPWKFSITRTNLATSSSSPPFEYDYSYPLPADCLRLLSVYDSSGQPIHANGSWTLEDGGIQTSITAPIYIKYIQQVTNPTKFDSLFDEALIARLAATIANDKSLEAQVVDRQWELYRRKVAEAQFVDSTERSAPKEYVSAWEQARA